jgi:hypothetical protein
LAIRLLSWAVVLALLAGFVYWTLFTLHVQAQAPQDAGHPFDWYADGCLGAGLVVGAGLLLSRPAPPPSRRKARGAQNALPRNAKTAKRMRRHRVQ